MFSVLNVTVNELLSLFQFGFSDAGRRKGERKSIRDSRGSFLSTIQNGGQLEKAALLP